MLDTLDNYFKTTSLNMLKELKENSKTERNKTVYKQNKNINKRNYKNIGLEKCNNWIEKFTGGV